VLLLAVALHLPGGGALPTPAATITYDFVEVSPGISLDVATAGKETGDTLLLLHGFPECSWLWRGVVDPMLAAYGRDLQLVMPDQRGFNHSSKPKGIGQYNASLIVEDAAGLIRHVQAANGNTGKVHVLAHDWGGPIGWLLAHTHPELVRTLTILNGPHPSVMIDELRHDKEQQKRSSYMLFFDSPAADLMDPASLFSGAKWFDPTTKKAYAEAFAVPGSRNAGLNWYRANIFAGRENVKAFTPDMPSTLPPNITIPVPTLVLWGMADTAFDNDENLARLTEYVPDLTIKKYENVSHWVAQEVPEKTSMDWAAFALKH
jgi:pimeloyl-ACP methyl ester carboxylesterase